MKKIVISSIGLILVVFTLVFNYNYTDITVTNNLSGRIIAKNGNQITVQDAENIIYTFESDEINANIGDAIVLKYVGKLNKNTEEQKNEIIDYKVNSTYVLSLNDNDLFGPFYELATKKLERLSLEEKIGQLFLVRYNKDKVDDIISNYKASGLIFYEDDFRNKTEKEVKEMINNAQSKAKITLLTAVDEEGGRIIRVSSNPNLVNTPFKASSELYDLGGFDLVKQDTIAKSGILKSLGLNLNLAPVVDVATDPNAYMYERTLKKGTAITSDYAKSVIEASKNTGVSYTLKHFPGYGNNADTHVAGTSDTRSYNDIKTYDLPPFKSGIEAGAEAVLMSHNVVSNLDSNNPASLSKSIHNLLRNELSFTGVVVTDDLDMGATSSINDKYTKALLAGNDLIITTNYEQAINELKLGINNQAISESSIDNAALRVLAWKYYKGIIVENEK